MPFGKKRSSVSVEKLNFKVFQIKWRINAFDFSLNTTGKCITSESFITSCVDEEIKWYLKFESAGIFGSEMIFTLNILSDLKVKVTCSSYFLDKGNRKWCETFTPAHCIKKQEPWRLKDINMDRNLICIDKNLVYNNTGIPDATVLDKEVTVVFEITIHNDLNHDQKSFSRIKEFDDFERLLLSQNVGDLTVISADEKKLRVSKGILAGRSPVFKALFDTDVIGKCQDVLKIQDFNYKILFELFRFIYCAKVNGIEDIFIELLRAAEKYNIQGLKSLCEETMMNLLNKSNAVKYLIAADKFNCSNVRKIIKFIVASAKDLINTPEYESLVILHPHLSYEVTQGIVYG